MCFYKLSSVGRPVDSPEFVPEVRPDYDVSNDVPHNAKIKIVLCGNSWTGKTALMNCYETGVFDENPDPTITDTRNMTRMHPEDCDLQLKLEV